MAAMGISAASATAGRLAGGAVVRPAERALVATAGVVFALASAGAAMTGAAADALFLSEVGPRWLGHAVAVSSALLAVVLAVVGGLSDRLERRRVLGALAVGSAIAIAGLAVLAGFAPRAAAIGALIGGKQLAAATDLAFWVTIAERIDARRSQRLLPLLAALGGIGATVGAVLVVPIAQAAGARGVLVAAAVLLALAGVGTARLEATRRVVGPTPTRGAGAGALVRLIGRSWREGARAVRRHPLARHLAVVVAAAGVFGSLAYFALGVAVAAHGSDAAGLAELLGGVRGAGQILTVIVQLTIAPRLLARAGTGMALLVAPAIALCAGLGLVVAPILAIAIATQISARVLDSGVETPAEKLAQTLLPTVVRGRIGGFLDGTAKRLGAIAGGLIAAVLAGSPHWFYAVTAVAAAIWLVAGRRIARELPALAVEQVVGQGASDADAVVDDRAIAVLVRDLGEPRIADRAADVLARLHERGRVDAIAPLVASAGEHGSPAVWRALVAVLAVPADAHVAAIAAAARRSRPRTLELAVRAVGLSAAGSRDGAAPDAFATWATDDGPPGLQLAIEIARARVAADRDGVLAILGDAVRETGEVSRVAVDELVVEVARDLAATSAEPALEPARHLVRALRRGRGDLAGRAAAYAALARVVEATRDQRSAELSLVRADLLELAREKIDSPHEPGEVAAAIRLAGALLDGADAIDGDDLRRLAAGLGEPDDDVRGAAEAALARLGTAAAGELITAAAWGRRLARDRAAALLADLPVTPLTVDRLIDAELDALDQTAAAIAAFADPADAINDALVVKRLDERLREIAHTVLLLVAARRRSPAIARAAAEWRRARGGLERARTLAVVEAALPRALVGRLVDAVDELSPADRAAALHRAGGVPPSRDAVIKAELGGRDRLGRALVLHALGAAGRGAHRDAIAKAAEAEAFAATPHDLVRRMTEALTDDDADEEGAMDMPSRVETLIALGRVPMLAALTTRQLADVAERARWSHAKVGDVIVSAGDPIDTLIVVDDGELRIADRIVAAGEVVDELACVAPIAAAGDLVVTRATRLIQLPRGDFEELVDDVPGLASAVCRVLGERARRAADASYRSPLVSRI